MSFRKVTTVILIPVLVSTGLMTVAISKGSAQAKKKARFLEFRRPVAVSVVAVSGAVQARSLESSKYRQVLEGDKLLQGDIVRVSSDSQISLHCSANGRTWSIVGYALSAVNHWCSEPLFRRRSKPGATR